MTNPNNIQEPLVNRVANSGLITLKPEEWITTAKPVSFDIKDYLFKGLILKEQEFRDTLKVHDWKQYDGKVLCIFCSVDAIIPSWAYMLVATLATPFAEEIFYGTPQQWITQGLLAYIAAMDANQYAGQRVVIKGCADEFEIGPEIYVALTHKLVPVVKSLMFGEPCSTVPVYKRAKEIS